MLCEMIHNFSPGMFQDIEYQINGGWLLFMWPTVGKWKDPPTWQMILFSKNDKYEGLSGTYKKN